MHIQPYLFFDGRAEEALAFYRDKLGAEITYTLRFNESPDPPPPGMVPPGMEHKIMHSAFRVGRSLVMASDGNCGNQPRFNGFSLSLSVPNAEEAQRLFGALAEGGQVQMPLGPTFFSPCFGMVADRFGVGWMVIVEPEA